MELEIGFVPLSGVHVFGPLSVEQPRKKSSPALVYPSAFGSLGRQKISHSQPEAANSRDCTRRTISPWRRRRRRRSCLSSGGAGAPPSYAPRLAASSPPSAAPLLLPAARPAPRPCSRGWTTRNSR